MNELFNDMLKRGLISTSSSWIERAVEMKHPLLTLDIAHSTRVYLDKVDLVIITASRIN